MVAVVLEEAALAMEVTTLHQELQIEAEVAVELVQVILQVQVAQVE
jgi:hypothetical protein